VQAWRRFFQYGFTSIPKPRMLRALWHGGDVKNFFIRWAQIQEAFVQLLELKKGWARDIPKWLRFIMLAIFSFFTYTTFKALGGLSMEQINKIIDSYFVDPGIFIFGSYVVFWSVVGLYSSLITAALVSSLVPKSHNK
jgi:hypothetical protein